MSRRPPLWPEVMHQLNKAGDQGMTAASIARGINLRGNYPRAAHIIVTHHHVAACCAFYLEGRRMIHAERNGRQATIYRARAAT